MFFVVGMVMWWFGSEKVVVDNIGGESNDCSVEIGEYVFILLLERCWL